MIYFYKIVSWKHREISVEVGKKKLFVPILSHGLFALVLVGVTARYKRTDFSEIGFKQGQPSRNVLIPKEHLAILQDVVTYI